MNKSALTIIITLTLLFAASFANENDPDPKNKTEVVADTTSRTLDAPLVREGGAQDASILSGINNTIGIYFEGGADGLPKKVADISGPVFSDISGKYSDKPHNIVFVHGSAGGEPMAYIMFDGDFQYKVRGKDLGKMIDKINEDFVKYCKENDIPANTLPSAKQTDSLSK